MFSFVQSEMHKVFDCPFWIVLKNYGSIKYLFILNKKESIKEIREITYKKYFFRN